MRNQDKSVPIGKKRKRRKNISKKEIYRWLYKIYQVLQSDKCQTIFKRLIDKYGEYYGECIKKSGKNKLIGINPYRQGFFNTLIHECLHAIDYNMPHEKVRWLAGRIVKKMSPAQYAHLTIAFARSLEKYYSLKNKKN